MIELSRMPKPYFDQWLSQTLKEAEMAMYQRKDTLKKAA
jgi:hypothetical protein